MGCLGFVVRFFVGFLSTFSLVMISFVRLFFFNFFLVLQDQIIKACFSLFNEVQNHGYSSFQVSKKRQSKNQGKSAANSFLLSSLETLIRNRSFIKLNAF